MKKLMIVISCLIASVIIVFSVPSFSDRVSVTLENAKTSGLFPQKVLAKTENPHTIHRLYNNGELVGVISSKEKLVQYLEGIYEENYEDRFPNSECALGKDLYLTDETSWFSYEDIDDTIFAWLKENDLFTVKATAVTFSDSSGIYAEIYVATSDLYEQALNTYLSFFIDPESLSILENGGQTAELNSYGTRDVSISISGTIETSQAYADPDEIMKDESTILHYLEYGDNTNLEYYTTVEGDTVAAVGAKNFGLSAEQVVHINQGILSGTNDSLAAGTKLCVTYFSSPINVTVYKETLKKETVAPGTIYTEDASLYEGQSEIRTAGVSGTRTALYSERWINGVLISGTLESSVDVEPAVNEVIAVGSDRRAEKGSGVYQLPVDHAEVVCGWGCYAGHRGVDFVNSYDRWGEVYAADRGTIESKGYNFINGNYVIINHNNGFRTYYGHLLLPCDLDIGEVVDRGEVIGSIGMTGAATRASLHFFIYDDMGERIDPCGEGYLSCG